MLATALSGTSASAKKMRDQVGYKYMSRENGPNNSTIHGVTFYPPLVRFPERMSAIEVGGGLGW